MHMADALISPSIGGAFWLISAGFIGYSAKKIAAADDSSKTALMAVMAAFVFAAQMINFTIPGTGSSGHIGGGLLLSILLGPHRAFISLASVLVLQSLFFADGGILALGCNIFNLAFFPAFIAFPLVYKRFFRPDRGRASALVITIIAALAGLLPGALFVVVQTSLSGISELPFTPFLAFMLAIHCAIGIVEGVVTWGVLSFVYKTEPSLVSGTNSVPVSSKFSLVFGVCSIVVASVVSWFASANPDGLEWAVEKSAQHHELSTNSSPVYRIVATVQEKLALLPDYDFPKSERTSDQNETKQIVNVGTSVAGLAGSLSVLAVALLMGIIIRKRSEVQRPQ